MAEGDDWLRLQIRNCNRVLRSELTPFARKQAEQILDRLLADLAEHRARHASGCTCGEDT
jgi:hypothetical protein